MRSKLEVISEMSAVATTMIEELPFSYIAILKDARRLKWLIEELEEILESEGIF